MYSTEKKHCVCFLQPISNLKQFPVTIQQLPISSPSEVKISSESHCIPNFLRNPKDQHRVQKFLLRRKHVLPQGKNDMPNVVYEGKEICLL
jgi:hypothetical protein